MEASVDQNIAIEPALLTPIVRKATGREDLRVEGWQVKPVTGGAEQGSAILRLSGEGTSAGEKIPWTLILKIIQPVPGIAANPQASHFWQREPRYYLSGILDDLPGGLRAPRCYAALERSAGFWIFLEDVRDHYNLPHIDHGWPFEYYRIAARCLGQFNGAYLTGKPIPEAEWIPRQWLRAYLEDGTQNVNLFFRSRGHPFFQRAFLQEPPGRLEKAWDERYEILEALDRLPQVFCHQDAFCRNLFAVNAPDGSDQLVAIDWSYAGGAALGSELSALVAASIGLGTLEYSQAEALEQLALEGYLDGLNDAGWRGNPDLIRFAFSAVTFWRYIFAATIGEMTPFILDERFHPALQQIFGGRTMDQLADFYASGNAWYTKLYEEAFRLKKSLML